MACEASAIGRANDSADRYFRSAASKNCCWMRVARAWVAMISQPFVSKWVGGFTEARFGSGVERSANPLHGRTIDCHHVEAAHGGKRTRPTR